MVFHDNENFPKVMVGFGGFKEKSIEDFYGIILQSWRLLKDGDYFVFYFSFSIP